MSEQERAPTAGSQGRALLAAARQRRDDGAYAHAFELARAAVEAEVVALQRALGRPRPLAGEDLAEQLRGLLADPALVDRARGFDRLRRTEALLGERWREACHEQARWLDGLLVEALWIVEGCEARRRQATSCDELA